MKIESTFDTVNAFIAIRIDLCLKFMSAPAIGAKHRGLLELQKLVKSMEGGKDIAARKIREADIFRLVFEENVHESLIKLMPPILALLASNQQLTEQNIDTLLALRVK
jgi:hypothetical protein